MYKRQNAPREISRNSSRERPLPLRACEYSAVIGYTFTSTSLIVPPRFAKLIRILSELVQNPSHTTINAIKKMIVNMTLKPFLRLKREAAIAISEPMIVARIIGSMGIAISVTT